jgi:hypothetical protein
MGAYFSFDNRQWKWNSKVLFPTWETMKQPLILVNMCYIRLFFFSNNNYLIFCRPNNLDCYFSSPGKLGRCSLYIGSEAAAASSYLKCLIAVHMRKHEVDIHRAGSFSFHKSEQPIHDQGVRRSFQS